MANLRDLVPALKAGLVAGPWDASSIIADAVASEFVACSVVTNSEASYDLTPAANALSLLGGAAYTCIAKDPQPVQKTGTTWARVTVPARDAGDNINGVVLGMINDGETMEQAFGKLNGVGITPGDGSFEAIFSLQWTGTEFNIQVAYVNNGTDSNSGNLQALVAGDVVYFGIDWATGIIYYQLNGGAPTSTGITLSAGFEALNWNLVAGAVWTAQATSFLAGTINFDLSDNTAGHSPFQTVQSAVFPTGSAGKIYEVSVAGTVAGVALNQDDLVAFSNDGLGFVRINNEPYSSNEFVDFVIFNPGVVASDGNVYKTWLEAYNAVKSDPYKNRIVVVDSGSGVTIPASFGTTATGFWQMEGVNVEGVNTDKGNQAAITLAENCGFNLNPAATVAGTSAIGVFKNCAITCNSTALANFTKTANANLANWVFDDCTLFVSETATSPAFLSNIANTDLAITIRGVCYFVAFAGGTLFRTNGTTITVQVYGTFNSAFFDKSTGILGSGSIYFDLYNNGDIDLHHNDNWSLFSGFSGALQVRSQLSVKSLVLDNDTDFVDPAIRHAKGQIGAPVIINGNTAIAPVSSQDYQVTEASVITFNTDPANAQVGALLRFFVTTPNAVSFAAGTAAVNTKAPGLVAQGQYSVVYAKRITANLWILWNDLGV